MEWSMSSIDCSDIPAKVTAGTWCHAARASRRCRAALSRRSYGADPSPGRYNVLSLVAPSRDGAWTAATCLRTGMEITR
jgi:hypothetical protein